MIKHNTLKYIFVGLICHYLSVIWVSFGLPPVKNKV